MALQCQSLKWSQSEESRNLAAADSVARRRPRPSVAWAAGVPLLAKGLTFASRAAPAPGCAILLAGVALNAIQITTIAAAE